MHSYMLPNNLALWNVLKAQRPVNKPYNRQKLADGSIEVQSYKCVQHVMQTFYTGKTINLYSTSANALPGFKSKTNYHTMHKHIDKNDDNDHYYVNS